MQSIEKKIILISTAILFVLSVYFFFANIQMKNEHSASQTQWIEGQLETYEAEETDLGMRYSFQLENEKTIFIIPIHYWKSFNQKRFDQILDSTANWTVECKISHKDNLSLDTIDLYELKIANQNLLNEAVEIHKRTFEKWAALTMAFFCIWVFFYYKRKL